MTAEPTTTEQGRIESATPTLKERVKDRVDTAATALKDKADAAKKRRAENVDQINPAFAFTFTALAVVGAVKVLGTGFRVTRAGVRAVKARRA